MVDVKVVKEGQVEPVSAPPEVQPEPVTVEREPEVKSLTPRLVIAAQRQEILSNLHLDLKVPRWNDPEIYVRYKPIEAGSVERSMKRRSGEDVQDESSLLFHADVLISACVGVFATLDGNFDKKYSLRLGEDGQPNDWPSEDSRDWTRFDRDLAKALGLEEWRWGQATNIVRALYMTDGDLIDASTELSSWSSKKNEKAQEDFTTP